MAARIRWLAPLGLALAACGSSSAVSDAGAAADAGAADAAPVDPNALVGAFNVVLVAPEPAMGTTPARDGYTSLVGRVSDGPTPDQIVWEPQQTEGGCRLLTPRVPFCATPCGGAAACVEDGVCQPYPRAVNVGTVKVRGLRNQEGIAEISITSIANNYQTPSTVHLEYPAFAEGDTIAVATESGAAGAFSVSARGIAPLVLSADDIPLVRGQPVTLRWTASGTAADSRVRVKLDISHHGGTKGKIECEVEDTGELVLSAGLVTALYDLGVAGYPTVIVTRRSSARVSTALGRVELVVLADVERAVTVPGLSSCTDDSECTGGKTCQPDLTCR